MTTAPTSSGLSGVAEAASRALGLGLPPVHLWRPDHCGDIDILIRADGVWTHAGAPIIRPELVRLFSTVLRKDPDGYHLVTPVEKLKIAVEDLPFRAVALRADKRGLIFTTDVGDEVEAGPDHPLIVDTDPTTLEPAPRVCVRADLWARVTRSVFYELVQQAEVVDGRLSVLSRGAVFALGPEGVGLE